MLIVLAQTFWDDVSHRLSEESPPQAVWGSHPESLILSACSLGPATARSLRGGGGQGLELGVREVVTDGRLVGARLALGLARVLLRLGGRGGDRLGAQGGDRGGEAGRRPLRTPGAGGGARPRGRGHRVEGGDRLAQPVGRDLAEVDPDGHVAVLPGLEHLGGVGRDLEAHGLELVEPAPRPAREIGVRAHVGLVGLGDVQLGALGPDELHVLLVLDGLDGGGGRDDGGGDGGGLHGHFLTRRLLGAALVSRHTSCGLLEV